jgi:hypothetical protein
MAALIGLHISAALYHQFFLRDGLLRRIGSAVANESAGCRIEIAGLPHNHRLRAFAFGVGSPPKSKRA